MSGSTCAPYRQWGGCSGSMVAATDGSAGLQGLPLLRPRGVLAMGSLPEGLTVAEEAGQCMVKQALSRLFNSLEIPQPVIVRAYLMDLAGWSRGCQEKELQRCSCRKRWWEGRWEILSEQNCEKLSKRI